jgi:hypothetical protein
MKPGPFTFDVSAAPPTGTTRRQTDEDQQGTMRAAADAKGDEHEGDQPIEEPGYGHGV